MAENVNEAVPVDADKRLFAEDLMEFVMKTTWSELTYSPTDFLRFRHLVYNGFTDAVKRTLHIIDEELDINASMYFNEMKQSNRLSVSCLTDFARKHGPPDLSNGFLPDKFLVYCTHVAYFTGYLFSVGFEEAVQLAIDLIIQAFPEGEMTQETWDCLEKEANKYVSIEFDFLSRLSPEWDGEEQNPANRHESSISDSSEEDSPSEPF